MYPPAGKADLTVAVREAVPADLEGILLAHEHAAIAGWAELYEPHGLSVPVVLMRERWRASFESEANRFAVYEDSGEILGVSVVAAPWLHALSVLPEHWGTGVATALHNDAVEAIQAASQTEALLRVVADNKRGRRFWEKMGWTLLPGSAMPHRDPPHFEMLTYYRYLAVS
jgi:GNAT superfamily N-acetyltransferase